MSDPAIKAVEVLERYVKEGKFKDVLADLFIEAVEAAIAAEREECAKLVESFKDAKNLIYDEEVNDIAEAIRSRKRS